MRAACALKRSSQHKKDAAIDSDLGNAFAVSRSVFVFSLQEQETSSLDRGDMNHSLCSKCTRAALAVSPSAVTGRIDVCVCRDAITCDRMESSFIIGLPARKLCEHTLRVDDRDSAQGVASRGFLASTLAGEHMLESSPVVGSHERAILCGA